MVLPMIALVPGLFFAFGPLQKANVYAHIASGRPIAPILAGADLPEADVTFLDFPDVVFRGCALEDREYAGETGGMYTMPTTEREIVDLAVRDRAGFFHEAQNVATMVQNNVADFLDELGQVLGGEQNVLKGFVSFTRPASHEIAGDSLFQRLANTGCQWLHAAAWLSCKRRNPIGDPWATWPEGRSAAWGYLSQGEELWLSVAGVLLTLLVLVCRVGAAPIQLTFCLTKFTFDLAMFGGCWVLVWTFSAHKNLHGVVRWTTGLLVRVLNKMIGLMVVNPKLSVILIIVTYMLDKCLAVCPHCHGAIPDCTGGDACPYFSLPFINAGILNSGTGAHTQNTTNDAGDAVDVVHTLLVASAVLPRTITRFLSRGVLDFFKTVARRPTGGGAQVDIETLSEEGLVAAVRGGSVTPDDALSSLLTRMAVATTAIAVTRLQAMVATIGQLTKLGASSTTVGTGSNGELLGVFTFAYTQAGRIVHHAGAALAVAGEASSSDTTEAKVILQAKILRPRSQGEFFHMLMIWNMICHAMGVAGTLSTNAFLLKVVFEQMVHFGMTWQQTHELFLVYLEAIETAAGARNLNLANVYESGGHDMYRERAVARAKEHFKTSSSSQGGGGADKKTDEEKSDQRIFRGSFNSSSNKCCITFNLGRANHPSTALDAKGKCLFNHKCDHFVSEQADGTKGGICGSTKHGRSSCDNPKQCDSKVAV